MESLRLGLNKNRIYAPASFDLIELLFRQKQELQEIIDVISMGHVGDEACVASNYPIQILAELAKKIHDLRQKRNRHLRNDLLGEPAWDILLDLFVHQVQGKRISVTSACLAANVPATTALRWLSVLEKERLIERQEDSTDKRRFYLSLTAYGEAAMTSIMTLYIDSLI